MELFCSALYFGISARTASGSLIFFVFASLFQFWKSLGSHVLPCSKGLLPFLASACPSSVRLDSFASSAFCGARKLDVDHHIQNELCVD